MSVSYIHAGTESSTAAEFQRVPEPFVEEKLRATLAASLALAGGFVLLQLADSSYLISRWNLAKHCPDLHAVATFARQIGCKL